MSYTGLLTACEQEHLLLLTSEKLLTMDRGTVQNMQSFIPRIEISASSWFYYKKPNKQ